MIAFLVFYFLRGTKKEGKILAMSIISGILAWVISVIVKDLIPGAIRPFIQRGFPPLTLTIPQDPSFPSGHTALSFGISAYVYLRRHKAGAVFIILSILVAVGRIVSNVHFPIDVAGGVILGIFSALLVDFLQTGLRKRG